MDVLANIYWFCFIIFINVIICTALEEEYDQNGDQPPQYFPQQNHPMFEKLLEDRAKWREPDAVRQPKVDVKVELAKLNFSHKLDNTWPTNARKLGVVSAVSFDNQNNVVVFHRENHVWNGQTFDMHNVYVPRDKGPIPDNTAIAFNRNTGAIAYEWGKNIFYMPHGLTVDQEDNFWVTDVALHQVMKFSNKNRTHPEIVLGTAFQPGNSQTKFCKPTAVAVLPDGDFFVADGYCNSRIIKYSKTGEMLLSWGHNSFQGIAFEQAPKNFFAVPHALTLAADQGLLCVADRENGRVQCFYTKDGTFHSQYHSPIVGDRLFSVAYAPVNGGQLYVVNGPQNPVEYHEVMGFVIDMKTKAVVSKFGPNNQPFENPHDIIVSPDGQEIYVAQLAPYKAFKFISIDRESKITEATTLVNAKPTVTFNNITVSSQTNSPTSSELSSTMQTFLIVAIFVSFALITLIGLWVIARRRKIGCLPMDSRNRRRHAWDFPSVKGDGFKLGNLLERKHGFEKLDQEASDEEPNASTTMLSSAQFA